MKPVKSHALIEVLICMAPNTSSAQQLYFRVFVFVLFCFCILYTEHCCPRCSSPRNATKGMSDWDGVPASVAASASGQLGELRGPPVKPPASGQDLPVPYRARLRRVGEREPHAALFTLQPPEGPTAPARKSGHAPSPETGLRGPPARAAG